MSAAIFLENGKQKRLNHTIQKVGNPDHRDQVVLSGNMSDTFMEPVAKNQVMKDISQVKKDHEGSDAADNKISLHDEIDEKLK